MMGFSAFYIITDESIGRGWVALLTSYLVVVLGSNLRIALRHECDVTFLAGGPNSMGVVSEAVRAYSLWMYRLWKSLLVTINLAIETAKGPPQYRLLEGHF